MESAELSIVYVWDADYPWDVRTEKVCLALTAAGHRVTIVARNKAWAATSERLPEGDVRRMRPWRFLGRTFDAMLGFPAFFNPRWVRLVDHTCKEVDADLIVVRDLPLCATAVAVGKRRGIPVMLDMAENYPAMMRALWETGRETAMDHVIRNPTVTAWMERKCLHAVNHIVVVVEESANRLIELGVPSDKITIVSNTPPLTRLANVRTSQEPLCDRLDLVYMGNLEVVRGLLETVDAVAHLRDAGKNVRLRVIGRGRDESLIKQRCVERGLDANSVEFLGYVASHAEALRIVAESDVGLIPHHKNDSWDTTIPNKLFDYMALGVPVVSSDAAPCARILAETGAGVVFRSGDAADMARAIAEARDPASASLLAKAGQAAVVARYNWEHDTKILLGAVAGIEPPANAN